MGKLFNDETLLHSIVENERSSILSNKRKRKQYNTLSAVSLLIEQINLGNLVTGMEGKYVVPEGIENIKRWKTKLARLSLSLPP